MKYSWFLFPTALLCNTDSYLCANSRRCIANDSLCDGVRDCEDGSDENCYSNPGNNNNDDNDDDSDDGKNDNSKFIISVLCNPKASTNLVYCIIYNYK